MVGHTCTSCNGTGRTGPVHINRGDAPHEWVDSMPCPYCEGGVVSEDRWQAMQLGAALRRERVARNESMLTQSKRLGLSPSELSKLQRGVGGMAAWHHPFATRAFLEATSAAHSLQIGGRG